jgi:putative ABC transport system substrate-binding protein
MRRRQFITLLGGAAAVWPIAARGQLPERMRRIGVLMNLASGDPEAQARIGAFLRAMKQLGWTDGDNMRIEYRWGTGTDRDRIRRYAEELVALAPDVILATIGPTAQGLQQATRTVPIVFAQATDAVAVGLVESLARPGGNLTGFSQFEFSLSGKLVELLKQIAPRVTRAGVIRDPSTPSGLGQLGAIQGAAPSLGVELTLIDVRDPGGLERAVEAFAHGANGGLIVPAGTSATIRRNLIIALAAQHRLPAIYPARYYVVDGGLISYGPDFVDQYRLAAGYVDRILKGEKPADLPVQAPTKYELAINLKTAKALGLTVPQSLLATADEVIE